MRISSLLWVIVFTVFPHILVAYGSDDTSCEDACKKMAECAQLGVTVDECITMCSNDSEGFGCITGCDTDMPCEPDYENCICNQKCPGFCA